MFVTVLIIGGVIAIATVVMTYLELIPFFKDLKELNMHTNTFKDRIAYPFRFIGLLPKLFPVLIDIGISAGCSFIGLSGGVMGALIGLFIGFAASCMVKIHRHWISPRLM